MAIWRSSVRMAWAQVLPRVQELFAAMVVIALGTALAAAMLLANRSLEKSFRSSVDALLGKADIEVFALSGGNLDESMVPQVRGVEGVLAAAPLLLGRGFLEDDARSPVWLIGVDMLDDATVRVYDGGGSGESIDDPLIFLSQPDSVLATAGFLSRHGFRKGEAFGVQTPDGRRKLVPRGVLTDQGVGEAFGGSVLILDLFAAQRILGASGGISSIDVVVDPGADVEVVATRLRAAVPSHLGIRTRAARHADLHGLVESFQTMMNALAAMGLILAGLITANRLATVYQRRMGELGVLRSQGMSPSWARRTLVLEALVLSCGGVLLGLPLGLGLAQVLVAPVAGTLSLTIGQVVGVARVPAALPAFAWTAVFGITSGVGAAWFPARVAVRRSVSAVLAGADRRDPWPRSRGGLMARNTILLLFSALATLELVRGPTAMAPILMVVACIAFTFAVEPGLRLAVEPISRLGGPAARIGVQDQSRMPSRAWGAAGVLMAGVALVVWITTMASSFETYVVGQLMQTRRADLVLEKPLGPDGEPPRIHGAILDTVRAIPGVSTARGYVSLNAGGEGPGLLAVDSEAFLDGRLGQWLVDPSAFSDALERVAAGTAVLADRTFLRTRHTEVGDEVEIQTPRGHLRLPLAGVTFAQFNSPRGDVFLSRDLYRRYWRDENVSRIYVVLEEGETPGRVAGRIEEAVGDRHEVGVLTRDQLAATFADAVREGFAFLDVLSLITLIVVLIGTADALSSNIHERIRELGTLRALGLSPASLARMVLAQATAVGMTGATLALFLGFFVGFEFVGGLLPGILGWRLHFQVDVPGALGTATLGFAACLLGAVLPAWRAARIPVGTILRNG